MESLQFFLGVQTKCCPKDLEAHEVHLGMNMYVSTWNMQLKLANQVCRREREPEAKV